MVSVSDTPEDDIIIELLEMYIYAILYARRVYPSGIFRWHKKYGMPVVLSIYPDLNNYVNKILDMATILKQKNQLYRIHLCVYDVNDAHSRPVERYMFDLVALTNWKELARNNKSECVHDWEYQARKALVELDQKLKDLKSLKEVNNTFKLFLETSQKESDELVHTPDTANCTWSSSVHNAHNQGVCNRIFPIVNLKPFNLNVFTSY